MWVLETVILDLIQMGFRKEFFNRLLKTIKVSAFLLFGLEKVSKKDCQVDEGADPKILEFNFCVQKLVEKVR